MYLWQRRRDSLFNKWCWGNQNKKSILYTRDKANSKWITDLNVKPKVIKLLEENTAENFCDLELRKDFLDNTRKVQSIKEQLDKLDFIKMNNFCPQKTSLLREGK